MLPLHAWNIITIIAPKNTFDSTCGRFHNIQTTLATIRPNITKFSLLVPGKTKRLCLIVYFLGFRPQAVYVLTKFVNRKSNGLSTKDPVLTQVDNRIPSKKITLVMKFL